jgi:hypothetical protein
MRLSVLIYVPSAREQDGRRPAMSLTKEYRARLRVSRMPTGSFVRFVALLVRFTGGVAHQSTARFHQDARSAGESGADASGSISRLIATKALGVLVSVVRLGFEVSPSPQTNEASPIRQWQKKKAHPAAQGVPPAGGALAGRALRKRRAVPACRRSVRCRGPGEDSGMTTHHRVTV